MAQSDFADVLKNLVENWHVILKDSVTIKVTPEELTAKSSEVVKKVAAMRRYFDDLNSLVRKTKEYWVGDAGEFHRKKYVELTEKIEECLKRLDEHPRDLVEIAQRFTDVELRIETDIQGLPGDVL